MFRVGAGFRDAALAGLIGLAFFAFLSITPNIPDGYDAYRHVRLAALMTEHFDVVRQDPWRLAYFWPEPVDVWFGYHLLLAPLTRLLDLIVAAKLLAAIIFGLISLTLLRILRGFAVQYAPVWVLIGLTGSAITFHRSMVSRPFQFCVLLTLLAAYFAMRNRPGLLALISGLNAISYSMYSLVGLGPGMWFLLRRDRHSLRAAAWCAAGVVAGLVSNPYFPQNVLFSHTVAAVPRIARAAHVEIGGELQPVQFGWFVLTSLPLIIPWAIAAVQRFRKWRDTSFDARTDLFFAVSALCLAGSFWVGRTLDLFAPFGIVFSALVLGPWIAARRRELAYLAFLLLTPCALNVFLAYRSEIESLPIERYRNVSGYLRTHAPGELVANTQWGDYYYLFFWNPSSRYVIGIEPTFTYVMDPRKYWIWRHVSDDEPTTCEREVCTVAERADIASTFAARLRARYILTDHVLNPRVEAALGSRPDVEEVFRDQVFSLYRLGR